MKRREEMLALAGVLLLALGIRAFPNLAWPIWGSDTGEYVFLTGRLVDTGRITSDYSGWGIAYPYFPGMFILSGAFSASAGLDVVDAVKFVTPLFNAVLVLGVFIVAHLLSGDARVGILAAAFSAVAMPMTFVTSHPLPAGPGHVFVVAILALFLCAKNDRRFVVPLAVVTVGLVLTHHLSVYYLVGILLVSIVLRELIVRRPDPARLVFESGYILALLLAAFFYWFLVATPLSGRIFSEATPVDPLLIAAIGLASVLLIPLAVKVAPILRLGFKPLYPSPVRNAALVGGTFILGLSFAGSLAIFGLPGTRITPEPRFVFFYTPLLALVSFVPLGIVLARKHALWWIPLGWLGALTVSFIFAAVTNSRVLLAYRHVDHMMHPVTILAALGAIASIDYLLKASRPGAERKAVAASAGIGLVLLVGLNAAIVYPPQEALMGFQEGVTEGEWNAVLWARDNIPADSTIAADHRLSSLLFGVARLAPTWDYTQATYSTENATVALFELSRLDIPAGSKRIDYVVLSDTMKRGVALLQWEPAKPMSVKAVGKFYASEAFVPIYSEGDTVIFEVDWTRAPGEALGV